MNVDPIPLLTTRRSMAIFATTLAGLKWCSPSANLNWNSETRKGNKSGPFSRTAFLNTKKHQQTVAYSSDLCPTQHIPALQMTRYRDTSLFAFGSSHCEVTCVAIFLDRMAQLSTRTLCPGQGACLAKKSYHFGFLRLKSYVPKIRAKITA